MAYRYIVKQARLRRAGEAATSVEPRSQGSEARRQSRLATAGRPGSMPVSASPTEPGGRQRSRPPGARSESQTGRQRWTRDDCPGGGRSGRARGRSAHELRSNPLHGRPEERERGTEHVPRRKLPDSQPESPGGRSECRAPRQCAKGCARAPRRSRSSILRGGVSALRCFSWRFSWRVGRAPSAGPRQGCPRSAAWRHPEAAPCGPSAAALRRHP